MANPPTSDPDLWTPPVKLCSALTKSSFAYESTAKRWPSILSNLLTSLQQASYALSYSSKDQKEKITEADVIADSVDALLKEIKDDKELAPIRGGPTTDGGPSTEAFDTLIEKEGWTWYNAPW
jgi:damage-control phosphatase, subfamily III